MNNKITITFDETTADFFIKALGYKVSTLGYLKFENGELVHDVVHDDPILAKNIGGFTKKGVYANDIVSIMQLTKDMGEIK